MMSNPLRQTELEKEELLMRESIQNAVDEVSDSTQPVRFSVRRKNYLGNEKSALIEVFKLRELSKRVKSYNPETETGWLKSEETCLSTLDDLEKPIPVLFLSDHNTKGLGGNWCKREGQCSRFHNLVLSVYASNKTESTVETLGSYGIGKMVYAIASKIRTIAYYSTFLPSDSSKGDSARFMASAFLPEHEYDGGQYTGHAFLGQKSELAEYPTEPLCDDEAHSIARKLKITPRTTDDTGLTVMLLDCDLMPDKCRQACETFWWPKIIDDEIVLDFENESEKISPPRPAEREDLVPFIHCYNNYIYNASPDRQHARDIKLRKYGNVGHLSLTSLTEKTKNNKVRINTVALIRNGLVIQYNPEYGREDEADVLGTFVATDSFAQHALKLSEPEAHDQWNQHSDRLHAHLEEEGSELVRRLHERIKTTFRDYQIRLKKQIERPKSDGLSFFDELLGSMFKKRRRGPPPDPNPSRRAFSIQKRGWRVVGDTTINDKLEFSVSLNSNVDVPSVHVVVRLSLKVLEAIDGVKGDTIAYELTDNNGQSVHLHNDTFSAELLKNSPLNFMATAEVHESWRTRWQISLERENSQI